MTSAPDAPHARPQLALEPVVDESISEAEAQETLHGAAKNLFDLRRIIAILFGIYGIILTVIGLVATNADEIARSGGINVNLWTGIGMLVLSAVFWVWSATRPLHRQLAEAAARSAGGGGEVPPSRPAMH